MCRAEYGTRGVSRCEIELRKGGRWPELDLGISKLEEGQDGNGMCGSMRGACVPTAHDNDQNDDNEKPILK